MDVFFTKMAERCLNEIEFFALDNHPQDEVASFVDGLVERNFEALSNDPGRYRYNQILLDFGVKFHERRDSSYRCLYEIDNNVVYIMLFLHTKQDLVSALYRHQLINT